MMLILYSNCTLTYLYSLNIFSYSLIFFIVISCRFMIVFTFIGKKNFSIKMIVLLVLENNFYEVYTNLSFLLF